MSAGWIAAFAGMLAALALADGARAAAPRVRRLLACRRPARADREAGAVPVRRRRDAARELLARHGVRTPAGLSARLAAAGISHPGAAEQAMALKCAAALGAALVALPPALRASAGGALLLLGGLPAAAFLVPDWIVLRRARARADVLSAQAPELLERVRLGAEAGLSPQRALMLAAARVDGLLAAELRTALGAIDLGMPAEAALRSLCARCPVPEVQALAAALRRSAQHGAPLAPAVARLAVSSRAERARRVHERAQGAAPKIQLVVALLLVPAALLLIAAALLAGMR